MTKNTNFTDLAAKSAELHAKHEAERAALAAEASTVQTQFDERIAAYNEVVTNTLNKFKGGDNWDAVEEVRELLLLSADAVLTDVIAATDQSQELYVFTTGNHTQKLPAELFLNNPILVAQHTRAVFYGVRQHIQQRKLEFMVNAARSRRVGYAQEVAKLELALKKAKQLHDDAYLESSQLRARLTEQKTWLKAKQQKQAQQAVSAN
jgi:hypothetical protein